MSQSPSQHDACNCPLGPDDRSIFCPRHQVKKYRRHVELCRMRGRYWIAWEAGVGPGQRDTSTLRRTIQPASGPGTELKKIIATWQKRFPWFDLSPHKGCGCEETAKWMDRLGVGGCQESLEAIVDRLEIEAKKRNLSIPFQRFFARRMVLQAIRRARVSR